MELGTTANTHCSVERKLFNYLNTNYCLIKKAHSCGFTKKLNEETEQQLQNIRMKKDVENFSCT